MGNGCPYRHHRSVGNGRNLAGGGQEEAIASVFPEGSPKWLALRLCAGMLPIACRVGPWLYFDFGCVSGPLHVGGCL